MGMRRALRPWSMGVVQGRNARRTLGGQKTPGPECSLQDVVDVVWFLRGRAPSLPRRSSKLPEPGAAEWIRTRPPLVAGVATTRRRYRGDGGGGTVEGGTAAAVVVAGCCGAGAAGGGVVVLVGRHLVGVGLHVGAATLHLREHPGTQMMMTS